MRVTGIVANLPVLTSPLPVTSTRITSGWASRTSTSGGSRTTGHPMAGLTSSS